MILNPEVAWAEPGSVTTDIFWLSASYFEEEFADSDSWSLFGVFSAAWSELELEHYYGILLLAEPLAPLLETETTSSLSLSTSESSSELL